ncbi:hypothetical protein KY311_04790, partial [Candidatus Woesearchaeota archaeon]|nr:hypothetical protein [Candidatus Woesearchaeota archaeon]
DIEAKTTLENNVLRTEIRVPKEIKLGEKTVKLDAFNAAALLPSQGSFYLEQPSSDYALTINPGKQTNYQMIFQGIKDE